MSSYTIYVEDNGGAVFGSIFQADDYNHAVEQALNAYPAPDFIVIG